MKTRIFAAIALFSALAMSGCNDTDGDTTPPVITLGAPAEGAVLSIGESIPLNMELWDNEMLGSYTVEIHDNFDGHGHKSSGDETTAFSYKNVWPLSGLRNTTIDHREIVIPDDATPGAYHLLVWCADAAGNQSMVARNIVLSRDGEHDGHDH